MRGCLYSTYDPLEMVTHMVQFVHDEYYQQHCNAMGCCYRVFHSVEDLQQQF